MSTVPEHLTPPATALPAQRLSSDTDSHPDRLFTPTSSTSSDTPSKPTRLAERLRAIAADMDPTEKVDEKPTEEVDGVADGSSSKPEVKKKTKEVAHKKGCKQHPKKVKKAKHSKKHVPSSSDDSSDDSSESSEDEESDSETETVTSSDSETDAEEARRRQKKKAKKAKLRKSKEKSRRKLKSRKYDDTSSDSESEESESSEESDSSDDESPVPKKSKNKHKKRKAKKKKKKRNTSESSDDPLPPDPAELIRRFNLGAAPGRPGRRLRGRGYGLPPAVSNDVLKRLKKKGSEKKKKKGSKVEYKRVDQLWDSTIHNYRLTETAEETDTNEYDEYVFTVRRKFDWEGKYESTVVDIKSKDLKDALNHVMAGVKGVSLVEETPVIDPNMLFLYLEELRDYSKELKEKRKTEKKSKARKAAARTYSHVKVMLKYLDEDYAETKKTLYPLLESNTITFDLLWALFKPNTLAYTDTYGNTEEPRAFKIEYATKECNMIRGCWYYIEGRYLEYDGKSFGMGQMDAEVEQFKGPRRITSLPCYPLKYHKDETALRAQLIERGKKFVALKGMQYRFHKGMAFYKKKRSVIKVNINGRIMVDPAIHRRINPNYPVSTVKPAEHDDLFFLPNMNSDDDENSDDCGCGNDSEDEHRSSKKNTAAGGLGDENDKEKTAMKLVNDEKGDMHFIEVKVDDEGHEIKEEKIDKLEEEKSSDCDFTDEQLLIASPVVLGFAFGEKLWLEFTVSGVHEIEWNEGAFNSLVLPPNQKSIVKALVESHTFHAAQNIDDVIQGKGKGLVAVLHGPPGTGKTLTAEGIAELLKCPLYMVSAGELGTDPRTLESELNKILDIAHSWGAVLLLDEADVFLEKRTIQDIHRNALVSIFLRLLEYFQGILFLTTNRVETFDDAFQSRIHIALRYGELTTKAKKTVWKMFLERVRAMEGVETQDFSENDYDTLARRNLNGRQIKNCVRTAQALAVNEKEKLSMEHIKRVLDVAESFDRDLKGGTGYMDAMRSYT